MKTIVNDMDKMKPLKEEVEEEQALRSYILKFNDEYFLERELTIAELDGRTEEVARITKELELVTKQRIQLKELYLRAKVSSAIAGKKDFIAFLKTKYGNIKNITELEKVFPKFFNENLQEAEDELRQHLEKYSA